MTRVKICGLRRAEDVEAAVALGASAVGFVLEPESPRCVGLAEIGGLLEAVPPYVARVAVMGPFAPGRHLASFDAVQAFGCAKSALEAGQRAISVYRVGSGARFPDQTEADAVLLDVFSETAFGGTGEPLDLVSARVAMAEAVRPVIVAGGLRPESVGAVIKELRPFAVDVSSGVENEPGKKDAGLLRAFFAAVREADDLAR